MTIISIDVPQSGRFHLRFTGSAGIAYEVLRSADLSAWSPIGQAVESAAGVFDFLDSDALTKSGYYQVRSVNP